MIEIAFKNIINGTDVKDNLIELKKLIKADRKEGFSKRGTLLSLIEISFEKFTGLLNDQDPKIRQNAAVVLGESECQKAASLIFQAYKNDDIRYNKSIYLEALSKLDYSLFTDELKKRRDDLISSSANSDEIKHIIEEMKNLNIMLLNDEKHEFSGYGLINEMVLLTNRNHKAVVMKQLKGIPHKEFPAGVMVKTDRLKDVMRLRTYNELLFVPDRFKVCSIEPEAASEELINNGIIEFISERNDKPNVPYRFRIDARMTDKTVEASFQKKLASLLEYKSKWKLINSVDSYEIEIRFIEAKDDRLNVLIRFCNLLDRRFTYRKQNISAGIRPANAALIMELARPYLRPDASVLDPFCGAGIMLAERLFAQNAKILYGIDIFGEAVQKAADNIKAAGFAEKCQLINRDFFDFRHEYKYSEIITDMPFATAKKELSDIELIYRRFFERIRAYTENDAILVIYTRNREFIKKYASAKYYETLNEFEFSKADNSYLYILKVK